MEWAENFKGLQHIGIPTNDMDKTVEFYKKNYEKNYHFEVYTAGVRTVMERVRDYLSDIGFVYVMEQQKKGIPV